MSTRGDIRKTAAWQRLRARVVAEETHCAVCGQVVDKTLPGRTPWAPSVDHIIPMHDDIKLALDRGNLRLTHVRCNTARGNRTRRKLKLMEPYINRRW